MEAGLSSFSLLIDHCHGIAITSLDGLKAMLQFLFMIEKPGCTWSQRRDHVPPAVL